MGQNPHFTCIVRWMNGQTHKPVSGVNCQLKPMHEPFKISNEQGLVKFHVPAGTYILSANLPPQEWAIPLSISGDTAILLEIHFGRDDLQPVVISKMHEHSTFMELGTSRLSTRKLQSGGGNTIAGLLSLEPGITWIGQGQSIQKPVIRGFSGNRIVTTWEKVRFEGQQWGLEHAPEIDPWLIDEAMVLKGAASAENGPNAAGGVISLRSAAYAPEHASWWQLGSGYESNGHGWTGKFAGSVTRGHHWSWKSAMVMRNVGDQHTPKYELSNTGYRTINGLLGLKYAGEKWHFEGAYLGYQAQIGILKAAHVSSPGDLIRAIQSPIPLLVLPYSRSIAPPRQFVMHHLGRFQLEYHPSEHIRWEFRISTQVNDRKEIDLYRGGNTSSLQPNAHLQLWTSAYDLTREARWKNIKVLLGSGGQIQVNHNFGRSLVIPGYLSFMQSIYAMLQKSENWEWGIRMDGSRQLFVLIRPSRDTLRYMGGFSTSFSKIIYRKNHHQWLWQGQFAWRPPHAAEWYAQGLHGAAATYELGNPYLKPEQNVQSEWHYNFQSDSWKFMAKGFVYYYFNYIYLHPMLEPVQTIRGTFPAFEYRQSSAVFTGMENKISYKINAWQGLDFYSSWLFSRLKETGKSPLNMPAPRTGIQYRKLLKNGKGWEGVLDIYYTHPKHKEGLSVDYAPPPAGYWMVQGALRFPVPLKKAKLECRIAGLNLLNASYRDYLSRYRYFADETGRSIQIQLFFNFHSHKNHD